MNVRMFALVGAAGLGLGAGACVDTSADSGLRIVANSAPGDLCVVDPSSSTFRDDGVIEAGSFFGYLLTPIVANDLVTIGDELTTPKTIYVTHARVDIDFYDPNFANLPVDRGLVHFQVATSGSIEPNGGRLGLSFEIVPVDLLYAIGQQLGPASNGVPPPRTTLDVSVQMVGTHGGDEVVSNVFRYPVEVCVGCLSSYVGECVNLPAAFEARTGGVCNTDQDGVLDCCTDSTGVVCPAAPPTGT
jgi:hypothetical protein